MNKIRLYANFAARRLKDNVMLAVLMITAIGVLISASMTTLMLLSAITPEPNAVPHPSVLVAANENWATSKKEWSVETKRLCDERSSGWIRWLL